MSTIYWLRNDLRLHDNECLHIAIERGKPLLLVYVFDPRQFEIMDLGFRKTGYLRFMFLCQSLQNLRDNCQKIGSNLIIKIGQPKDILSKIVTETEADLLIFQKEIASEEETVEAEVIASLKEKKCSVQSVWGKTMYHVKDSPFDPKETPLTSKAFRMNLTKKQKLDLYSRRLKVCLSSQMFCKILEKYRQRWRWDLRKKK